MEQFRHISERLFQTSDDLRNKMAEIQQLRAAIQSVEAAARRRGPLGDPKAIAPSAERELRA